jgi:hypothetical protein
MITDTSSQGDLIAAPHLGSLFDSGHWGSIGDKNNRVRYVEPAIHCPNEYDVARLRHRLIFNTRLAVSAQDLLIKTDMAKAQSIEKGNTATSHAAANCAVWRT